MNKKPYKNINDLSKPRNNSKEILITALNTKFKKNHLAPIIENNSYKDKNNEVTNNIMTN